MTKEILNPSTIVSMPAAYSQAVKVGNTIYISGQVAWDKEGKVVGGGDCRAQAEKAYENMGEVLKAAGANFRDVVKLNVYFVNPDDMTKVRGVREKYFGDNVPANTTVVVQRLARPELLLEIEAVAVVQ
ncbi:MAG: RidA family protein [Chloroflexi bacterium]|nr:RidA family protein [Chloroflexota bacterium]